MLAAVSSRIPPLYNVSHPTVLVVAADVRDQGIVDALRALGVEAVAVAPGANLVPDALQSTPQVVLWRSEGTPDAAVVEPLAALARARFEHEQSLRRELDAARARLDERKLVDRAKGILMRGRSMSEDEAFGVLRTASMQAQARVGEVSERVIGAARDADAVNRAGQLRMLSQRIVKLAALRLAGIDPAGTRERLDASVGRAEHLIAVLGQALADSAAQDAYQHVVAAWQALHAALKARPRTEHLGAFDALAEALLAQADALTQAVEAQGGPTTLHVVNLCGRQRMLVQRLAKQALLATMLREPEASAARTAAADTALGFEQALAALAALPIRSSEIRDSLDEAERAWQQMRDALREANGAAGRRGIAHASESLLELFDRLTAHYEHSLQVILG